MLYEEALSSYEKLEDNKDTTFLFNFLQDLITQVEGLLVAGKNDDAFQFEPIFEKCLYHRSSSIKLCGIEGVLFTMHLEDEKYVQKAFEFLYYKIPLNEYGFWYDYEIDSDLKLWSASGLGATFAGTKNKRIIKGLLKAIEVNKENNGSYGEFDDSIRVRCFTSILSIYFNYLPNQMYDVDLSMNFDDIDFEKYKYSEIKRYLIS